MTKYTDIESEVKLDPEDGINYNLVYVQTPGWYLHGGVLLELYI